MGYIPPVHDYILCYGKNAGDNSILGFPLTEEYIRNTYDNPDNDPRGPWTTSDLSANHEGPLFEIVNPKTGRSYLPAEGRYWVFNEAEVRRRIDDGRIIFGKTGNAGPIQKKYLSERESTRTKPESWWDKHGLNSDGTAEIARLLSPKAFDHSKPTSLLKNILKITTSDSDLIVDFFAGSGSTAHAIMDLNKEDGANRRYICVQLPEACKDSSIAYKKCNLNTIADLCKERIRRAGQEILDTSSHEGWCKDIGFRVLKIDTSNMADVHYSPDALGQAHIDSLIDNIKPDRTAEDLLCQVMLDWGVDLALPIARRDIQGKEVFLVDDNALAACFDDHGGVDEPFVKELALLQPLRVVFRDAGFKDSAMKINVEQIFKLLSPSTEVKCL
jgi:adenine-specific DNA-methyltransferase